MSDRRRTLDITSRRFDLGGAEEVGVGGYARRIRRGRFVRGTIGILLAGAAWFLYHALNPEAGRSPDVQPVLLRCAECAADSRRLLPVDQVYPVQCGKCGALACRPLWQCRAAGCGTLFLPAPNDAVKRCPKCGSDLVGNAPP